MRVIISLVGCLALSAIFYSANADESSKKNPCHQYYPNISGEVLLENDKMVVQRFIFPPGVWEGIHSHPPNQLYIHLKGGEWTVKYGNSIKTYPAEQSPTGSVGWYGPVSLSEKHESMNSGDESIDLIWVTLKESCMK